VAADGQTITAGLLCVSPEADTCPGKLTADSGTTDTAGDPPSLPNGRDGTIQEVNPRGERLGEAVGAAVGG